MNKRAVALAASLIVSAAGTGFAGYLAYEGFTIKNSVAREARDTLSHMKSAAAFAYDSPGLYIDAAIDSAKVGHYKEAGNDVIGSVLYAFKNRRKTPSEEAELDAIKSDFRRFDAMADRLEK